MPSLSDLLNMGKRYVKDAMPGGLLNPEVNRQDILDGAALSTTAVPVLGDLLGLGADINRYATDPESRTAGNFALSGLGMLPFVPAMTAWHGSPHKFDKFSLDKIGTGEGAQAYGHGLYLAESPNVAREYAQTLDPMAKAARSGIDAEGTAARVLQGVDFNKQRAIDELTRRKNAPHVQGDAEWAAKMDAAISHIQGTEKTSNLYKTDIPDEAVARFLDWDKPLSQQAPEVQAAINKASSQSADYLEFAKSGDDTARAYKGLSRAMGGDDAASRYLAQQGIPGIRYLDGGSRPTGQVDKQLLSMLDKHGGDPVAAVDDFMRFVHNTPAKKAAMRDQFLKELQQNRTSNFVAFDPEMIRILERNGQPTGLGPWKPGEYSLGGLLGR